MLTCGKGFSSGFDCGLGIFFLTLSGGGFGVAPVSSGGLLAVGDATGGGATVATTAF